MKIGKATVPRTAICTSDEHTIVVRGRDLSKDLIGKVSFVDHFFLLLTGRMPTRAASRGAQRDAGRDRRARPGAERAGGAHDLRRRARRDAGRGRGRHPRLRLGGARLVRDRRAACTARSTRKVAGRRRRLDAAALAVMQRLARRRQADPGLRPSAAQGARRARRRAVRRSPREAGTDLRFVAIAEAVEALHAGGARQAPEAQRLGRRFRRCCSAPAFRSRRSRACRSWRAPPA